jgi:hypothetical protein
VIALRTGIASSDKTDCSGLAQCFRLHGDGSNGLELYLYRQIGIPQCVEVWPGLLRFGYPVSLPITRATEGNLMILIQCSCYPALRRSHSCGYDCEAKYYSTRHALMNDEIHLVDTNCSSRTTYLHGRAWRSAVLHLRVPGLLAASLWMHTRNQYRDPAEAVYQATLCRVCSHSAHNCKLWPASVTLLNKELLITIFQARIIFRLIEYSNGIHSSIPRHEVYQYCLDSLLMLIGSTLFNVVHPGRIMPGVAHDLPPRVDRKMRDSSKQRGNLLSLESFRGNERA